MCSILSHTYLHDLSFAHAQPSKREFDSSVVTVLIGSKYCDRVIALGEAKFVYSAICVLECLHNTTVK